MNIKIYPNLMSPDGSYSAKEVQCGYIWLNADVTCPHCNKIQPVAVTNYIGGPCCACGKLTSDNIKSK